MVRKSRFVSLLEQVSNSTGCKQSNMSDKNYIYIYIYIYIYMIYHISVLQFMLNEIGTNTNSPLLSIQLLKQCPKVCIATKMNSHLRFFHFLN